MPLSDKQRQEIREKLQQALRRRFTNTTSIGEYRFAEDVSEDALDILDQELDRREAICRKIFIEEVDWSEWGISDKEAGQEFDEALKLALLTPTEEHDK